MMCVGVQLEHKDEFNRTAAVRAHHDQWLLAEAIVARDGEGAPPRPSDAVWYDEHCYNRSPRR
jgi:hypothetical protein